MKKFLYTLCLFFFACQMFAQTGSTLAGNIVVADTHNDVLSSVVMHGLSIEKDLTGKSHSDLARMKKGGIGIQVFSVFCNDKFGKDTAFKQANIEIDSLTVIASRNTDKMMLVATKSQLHNCLAQKKLAALIGVEGGHMIEDRLDYLDSLHKRGAVYLTLTWNNSTSWATSAADESKNNLPFGTKGLTEFGKSIVRRMNELGMMVDLSHVGEKTFHDALSVATKPVIASHSSVYALCPHPRNLKDDQIRAIGKNGGVIFVNFYSGFIDSNYNKRKDAFLAKHKQEADSLKALKLPTYEIDEWVTKKYPQEADALRPPLSLLIDHIDYLVKMIGIDHVGLGSDFDGIESAPKELNDVRDYPKIAKALQERGYSRKDIEKIFNGNFIRVFGENVER
jgi:membrane dipeptidase